MNVKVCGKHARNDKWIIFFSERFNGKENSEDPDVNKLIIFKFVSKIECDGVNITLSLGKGKGSPYNRLIRTLG